MTVSQKLRGSEAGWNRLLMNDPDASWRTAKALARLCGTDLRNCQRWIKLWLDQGKIEVRSGVSWGRQFRRVVPGRTINQESGESETAYLPTVSASDEFRAIAADALPTLLSQRLAAIAAQSDDPRASMTATKLQIELGVGQVPTEEEVGHDDHVEVEMSPELAEKKAALDAMRDHPEWFPQNWSIEELQAEIARLDEVIANGATQEHS